MDKSEAKRFKGFFWGYIIIALITVVGGIYSIHSRINEIAPTLFALDSTPGPVTTTAQDRLQQIADMKLKDSDSDGLNDYDETYVYSTSPYLADSDSDGTNDKAEIDAGTDPNCATGSTCKQITAPSTTADQTNTNGATTNTTTDTTTAVTNLDTSDPKALRAQLLKLGIPQNVLDQVSDTDLVDVYSSVSTDYAKQQDSTQNTNTTDPYANLLPASTNTDTLGVNPSAADLRAYMLQVGVPSSQLDGLDDASLLSAYQQLVQEQQALQTNQSQTQ